jgi:hypothetical protein
MADLLVGRRGSGELTGRLPGRLGRRLVGGWRPLRLPEPLGLDAGHFVRPEAGPLAGPDVAGDPPRVGVLAEFGQGLGHGPRLLHRLGG